MPGPPGVASVLHAVALGLLLVVSVQLALNLRRLPRLSWARPPRPGAVRPSASVLVPARNEEGPIAACVAAWLAQWVPADEVLVLDDESTDGTRARALAATAGAPGTRVLAGARPPRGWGGKAFACHQLARAARGDVLVFADADVKPSPRLLGALLGLMAQRGLDAVSVLPRQTARSRLGRHLAPLQAWALATFCPLWLPRRRPTALLSAASGALLAVRRAAYGAAGGHAAVWQSLAEDVDLGRRLAAAGVRVHVVDGTDLATCRGYETLRAAWDGNTKNLFAVLFHSRLLVTAAALALVTAWVAPWLTLAAAIAGAGDVRAPAAAVALGLAGRLAVAARFGFRPADAWGHPLLVGLLSAMLLGSAWTYARGRARWRGREYAPGRRRARPEGRRAA
jgi:cellulose synthase/poly-beta-1,6-N-acetylglucosamine synthase-like glycosyltransferase